MKLRNEAGLRFHGPPWLLVAKVLHDLDPGHGNSFASLNLPGNTYVQALCGFNGWWRRRNRRRSS